MKASAHHLAALVLGLLLVTGNSSAAVYMERDAEGNITFTDHPASPTAKPVELPPPSTYQPPPLPPPQPAAPPAAAETAGYTQLHIVSPANDEPLRENNGQVNVELAISPALKPGHRLRLLLDGQVVAEGTDPHFQLDNVDRGTHQLQVDVVSADGQVLLESPVTTFHLLRYHPPAHAP